MKNMTQLEMSETISWIRSTTENASTWSLDQAPAVVQEFIRWEIISQTMTASIFAVIFLAALFFLVGMIRAASKGPLSAQESDGATTIIAVSFITMVICAIPMGFSTFRAVKAHVAPRVVVIEEINTLNR